MAQREGIGYEALHRNGPYTRKSSQLKWANHILHGGKSEVKLSLALFTDCHCYLTTNGSLISSDGRVEDLLEIERWFSFYPL